MLKDIYLNNANIPKRYLNDIDLFPSKEDENTFIELNEIKNNVIDFVNNGNNLLIYSSNVGNGKTTFATKILKQYINNVSNVKFKYNCPGLFINTTSFLNEKKLAISDISLQEKVYDIEKKILSANLVIFDDIGVKNISDYDLGSLYYWIDYRTSENKSCIYTSNLNINKLANALDGRLYSRIVNYSIIKEIKDGDSREVINAKSNSNFK